MPHNFDEIRDSEDLSFVIRGETFKVKRASAALLDRIVGLEKKISEINPAESDSYFEDAAAIYEEKLLLLIDDSNGAVDRWNALREGETVAYGELVALNNWVTELVAGLPTLPPEPSASGRGKTAATSKAG